MENDTQPKKNFMSRVYKKFKESNPYYKRFKGSNPTVRRATITYVSGLMIAAGFMGYQGITEPDGILQEHERIESQLNSLYDTPIKVRDLVDKQYRDSLVSLAGNLKAKKDSLEAVPDFVQAKNKGFRFPLYGAVAGIVIMAGSLPFMFKKKQKKVKN